MRRKTIEPEDARHLLLLKQFGEAWNAGDIDTLISMITDDGVYCASVGPEPGTTFVGKAAVREGFLAMLAFDSGGLPRAGTPYIAGSVGVSEWSYLFRAASDAEFEVRGCDIFEFRNGRISRKDAFRKSFPDPTPGASPAAKDDDHSALDISHRLRLKGANTRETPQQYTERLLGYVEGKDPLKVQRATPKKLAELIRGLSREQLTRKPAPGKWSIREILAHLADAEIVVAWRLRHILGHNGTSVQAYDQNVWAEIFDYAHQDAKESLGFFGLLRTRNLAMLKALPKEFGRTMAYIRSEEENRSLTW